MPPSPDGRASERPLGSPPGRRPTLSRLYARGRVGADFFTRSGVVPEGVTAPAGLIEALSDYGNPGVDPARVHPAVAPFFLAPGSLELRVESRWHHVFALVWWLLRPVMGWLGQLHLPRKHATVHVRTVALDSKRDGRSRVRGVLRLYDDGSVMQVMAYAIYEDGRAGYMSAAFPFPYCTLNGVLRMDALATSEGSRGCGVRLTTRASEHGYGGSEGIWLAPARGPALPLPLGETLCLWGADDPSAPREVREAMRAGETLVGVHEQRLCGLRFATHYYWFRPRP